MPNCNAGGDSLEMVLPLYASLHERGDAERSRSASRNCLPDIPTVFQILGDDYAHAREGGSPVGTICCI
jgi:hypothetical protein